MISESDKECSPQKQLSIIDNRSCTKPTKRIWFKGVRSSKFRHVYGEPAKREKCYENIQITKNAHDSQFCAVNPKFLAVVTEVAGGGAFIVIPITCTGRLDFNASKVTGHSGPILDIKWNPFNDNVIASCSDDCTIKLWHIPDGGLAVHLNDWLVELQGHKRRVAYIEWHPTAENVLFSAGFDHLVIVWNIEKGEAINVIDCHNDAIHSMSLNRDGSLLATTCKDKKLRVIEPRSGIVKSEGICHEGSKASKVAYLGSSGRLLTTGFSRHSDRRYAVWDENNLSKALFSDTIDSSSGIVFPFYDPDTNIVFLAGKGDGNIRFYEISDEPPYIHYLSQVISGNPQRGLGVMPKRGLNSMHCEIYRFFKLHATKGMCEPISMIVPRKSDQFHEDLYPDTAAAKPALTAQEWIKGANSNPILISMKEKQIQKKWKNLRDSSVKERNLQGKEKKSDSGKCSRKKYIYFDSLTFLQPTMNNKETVSNLEPEKHSQETRYEDDIEEQSADNSSVADSQRPIRHGESSGSAIKCKKDDINSAELHLLQVMAKRMAHNANKEAEESDDDKLFLMSLAGELKKVPNEYKLDVKTEILPAIKKWQRYIPSGNPGSSPLLYSTQVSLHSPSYTDISQSSYGESNSLDIHAIKQRKFKRQEKEPSAVDNNRRKFQFLSTETIPDYRPKELIDEKSKKTTTNQTTKFQQLQQRWSSTIEGPNKDIPLIKEINSIGDNILTEHDLRAAYQSQSDEIRKLKKHLANSEQRVKELEEQIRRLIGK